MDVGKEFRIKISEDGMGLTQALKKFIEQNPNSILSGDKKITCSEWNETIKKLIDINNKRTQGGGESIFEGGNDSNDWQNNFVVHKGDEIVFSADEMGQLFQAMGLTINPNFNQTPQNKPDAPLEGNQPNDSTGRADTTIVELPKAKGDTLSVEPPKVEADTTENKKPVLNANLTGAKEAGDEKTEKTGGRYSLSWGEIGKIAWKSTINFGKSMVCDEEGKFSLKNTAKTVGVIAGVVIAAPIAASVIATGLTALGVTTIAGVSTAVATNAAVGAMILTPIVYSGGKNVIEGTKEYYQANTKDAATGSMEQAMDGAVELVSIPVLGELFKAGSKLVSKAKTPAKSTKPNTELEFQQTTRNKSSNSAQAGEGAGEAAPAQSNPVTQKPVAEEFNFDFEVHEPVVSEPAPATSQPVRNSGKPGKKGKKQKQHVEKFRPESEQVRRAREAREAKAAEEARLKAEEAKPVEEVKPTEEPVVEQKPVEEIKPVEEVKLAEEVQAVEKPAIEEVAPEPVPEPVAEVKGSETSTKPSQKSRKAELAEKIARNTSNYTDPVTGCKVSEKPVLNLFGNKIKYIERTYTAPDGTVKTSRFYEAKQTKDIFGEVKRKNAYEEFIDPKTGRLAEKVEYNFYGGKKIYSYKNGKECSCEYYDINNVLEGRSEFNLQGRITGKKYYREDGKTIETEISYDPKTGKRSSEKVYNVEGKAYAEATYDPKTGNMKTHKTYYEDGKSVREEITYDPKTGKKNSSKTYYEDGKTVRIESTYDPVTEKEASLIFYGEYDPQTMSLNYGTKRHNKITYDPKTGNKKTDTYYHKDGVTPKEVYNYETETSGIRKFYDENNNLVGEQPFDFKLEYDFELEPSVEATPSAPVTEFAKPQEVTPKTEIVATQAKAEPVNTSKPEVAPKSNVEPKTKVNSVSETPNNIESYYSKNGTEFFMKWEKVFSIEQTTPKEATFNLTSDADILNSLRINVNYYVENSMIQTNGSYGMKARQLSPGKMELVDGKWVVTEPVKIEFVD